jgi:pimeloyl-ACP methyl ester carboxylesterase
MRRQRISPLWWWQDLRRRLTGHTAAVEPRLIHRDGALAIAWLPGTSTRLVLVFLGITYRALSPARLEFRGIASDQGRNHVLFINDRRRSWYSWPGMRDRVAEVVRGFVLRQNIDEIWSIGNSMGGYGAILFRDRLPLSNVVAFVPQILMSERVIEGSVWSANRPDITDAVERDLTPIMAASDTRYHLVYGDRDQDDPIHLDHLRQHLPDAAHVRIVIAPGQQHYVAKWLKDQGQLSRLVAALWAGDRQKLEDCSKALETPLNLSLA